MSSMSYLLSEMVYVRISVRYCIVLYYIILYCILFWQCGLPFAFLSFPLLATLIGTVRYGTGRYVSIHLLTRRTKGRRCIILCMLRCGVVGLRYRGRKEGRKKERKKKGRGCHYVRMNRRDSGRWANLSYGFLGVSLLFSLQLSELCVQNEYNLTLCSLCDSASLGHPRYAMELKHTINSMRNSLAP